MKALRYPVHISQDEDDPRFWNARIPGIGGGDGLITCGGSEQEAREMASDLLDGYVLSKLEMSSPLETPPVSLPRGKGWEWVSPGSQVSVALLIREAREQARLTQAEAAKLMGVAPSTYNRWEQPGRCNATLLTLEKIARVLGRHLEVQLR